MNLKRIFSIFLLLAGEILIIISFLFFGRNLDSENLTLNIIISTIIFSLFFIDLVVPRIDFKDKSQKTVGSLGLKAFFTTIYIVCAIGAIIIFIFKYPIDINAQILIHAILLFFLLIGLYFAISASNKVQQVYYEEKQSRSNLDNMKKITKEVQQKFNQLQNIPDDIIARMSDLQENLRFVSPSNNPESVLLQTNFQSKMKEVQDSLFDIPLNYDNIKANIRSCEIIYNEIKQNFSN